MSLEAASEYIEENEREGVKPIHCVPFRREKSHLLRTCMYTYMYSIWPSLQYNTV